MMIKLIAISIAFIFSILLLALVSWFEVEEQNVNSINKEHLSEIKRLKRIIQINEWLDKIVKPSLDSIPKNIDLSDDSLVKFYDIHSKEFHFQVNKYIYKDENTHNLDIKFTLSRGDKEALSKLMNLKYSRGFLKFKNIKLNKDKILGEIQVVQPFYGENNASNK